ncbi:MAG: DNA repair protein RecO [Pseudomonadota bacterium]
MSQARVDLTPAYVIHSRAYRDTSLIIEVFTAVQGRLSLLVRGAKSGKLKKSLILQPFRKLQIAWAGRGELPILSAVEEVGGSMRLQGESLACGYYINELIYHLLPRFEAAPELFVMYWPVVESITDEAARDSALRRFEFSLLQHTGYAPLLGHEWNTGDVVDTGQVYRYRVPEGPEFADQADGLMISGQTLLELEAGQFDNLSNAKEARDLARILIHYQLNGRELLSRSLFSSLQKNTNANGSANESDTKD